MIGKMLDSIGRGLNTVAPYTLPILNACATKQTHSFDHQTVKDRIDNVVSPSQSAAFIGNMQRREDLSKVWLGVSCLSSAGTIYSRWATGAADFYTSSRIIKAITTCDVKFSGNGINALSTIANLYTLCRQGLTVHNSHFRGNFGSLR